jgi:hypothetical protein
MKNKKPLTAKKLLNFLIELEASGENLGNIHLLYRYDRDSDEELIYEVEEDLYDPETNSILETIMFLTNDEEL